MLAKRLKQARLAKKLTQEQLANMVNTKKSTISNYENEYSSPSNEMLYDLANALEITTDYLLGRVDDPYGFRIDYAKTKENNGSEIVDEDFRKIERFARNLTPKDRKKALKILEATFDDAFKDEDDDDDDL